MHALIIEDEFLIAMAIEQALRDCGFTSFDLTNSAGDAIKAAAIRCPDLITADVQLSSGSGIDTVQSICSETVIPVIFVTGSADEVRLRMPGYTLVDKPFSADQIGNAIRRTLTGKCA